jgi:choice-of-anchor A domain-containing protein
MRPTIWLRCISMFLLHCAAMAALRASPINLGAAGPGNWAILEIGAYNVSLAAAPPYGYVDGNIGVASGGKITSSAGNFPIDGSVFLGTTATNDAATTGNATGGIFHDAASQSLLAQATSDALAASLAAKALASSGGGVGVTSITAGGTLTPGVYNLTNLNLPNGAVLTLSGGGYYVFNITGTLAMHSSTVALGAGLSADDVLYNVTGTQGVAFSGGLNAESSMAGIILAPTASISLTPGFVNGEIISGRNINIASGGSVNGITVDDASDTLVLICVSVVGLILFAHRFSAQSVSQAVLARFRE